ncbi:MAG: radical SAM protein [Anaerolineae bacterium]|nr:radical SAM protein [Anaerolineae bacterium]
MRLATRSATQILTPQRGGFLRAGPWPFTHSLSWSAGCGLGRTYCGRYCYAQYLPNWVFSRAEGEDWGEAVIVKENAAALLGDELARAGAAGRRSMRIFMSTVSDPWQPVERKLRLTRQCLEVFVRYPDIDLLLLQTRSPTVLDDADRIAALPSAWLGMTLETDRGDLDYGPTAGAIRQRLTAIEALVAAGVRVQVAVAPCLPHSEGFADLLLASGAQRFVVDTFSAGDGSDGARTAKSPLARQAGFDWRDEGPARRLYEHLHSAGAAVGWSAGGFAGIPPGRLL